MDFEGENLTSYVRFCKKCKVRLTPTTSVVPNRTPFAIPPTGTHHHSPHKAEKTTHTLHVHITRAKNGPTFLDSCYSDQHHYVHITIFLVAKPPPTSFLVTKIVPTTYTPKKPISPRPLCLSMKRNPKSRYPDGWHDRTLTVDPFPDHLHPRPCDPVTVRLRLCGGMVTEAGLPDPDDMFAPPVRCVVLVADGSDGWRPAGHVAFDTLASQLGVGYRVAPRAEWFGAHPDGHMRG